MKKIFLFIVAITVVLMAGSKWNIPNGLYNCEIISINDKNWKPIKFIPKKIRKKNIISFILSNDNIVDVDGMSFLPSITNSEKTNIFINTNKKFAIYIPKNAYVKKIYHIGIGKYKNKTKTVERMLMKCLKQNY